MNLVNRTDLSTFGTYFYVEAIVPIFNIRNKNKQTNKQANKQTETHFL
jgi:hypothetical protein